MTPTYALMTAARNEGRFIGKTIESILEQTILPSAWVIVSDSSTDDTDDIVQSYAKNHGFVEFLRRESATRSFDSQAASLNLAYLRLRSKDFAFVGCLDADITLAPEYYANVLGRMADSEKLGIAGGWVFEPALDGTFVARVANREHSVPGAIQLFNRDCFESLGAFLPLPHGGLDTHAEVAARKQGWKVQAFRDQPVYHHRPTGSAGVTRFRSLVRQGRRDWSLGYHPLYEAAKLYRRLLQSPPVLGSSCMALGYFGGHFSGERRLVDKDFIAFIRKEQLGRLRRLFGNRP